MTLAGQHDGPDPAAEVPPDRAHGRTGYPPVDPHTPRGDVVVACHPKGTTMASQRRKSAAIALAVVGIAGLSLASAAQLNLDTASLGAGSQITAACDTDGIDVDFTSTRGANGQYRTSGVVLSDVATACAGLDYRVTLLTGPTGAQTPLGAEVAGTDLALTSGAATFAVDQLAADVTGVSVVIFGR